MCRAAVLALLAPGLAGAQADTLAVLRGRASSSLNGRPLAGVMVAVPSAGRFVVTDSTGTFTLASLPAGPARIRISYLERGTTEHDVTLRAGTTTLLSVLLNVEAVDLAPVVVEGRGGRFERSLAGFYDRKERTSGMFYTPEDLERLRPSRLSSLLGQAGIIVRCRLGECRPYAPGPRPCPLGAYFDALPIDAIFLDTIDPRHVAGVEIYRRGSQVPIDFSGPGSPAA